MTMCTYPFNECECLFCVQPQTDNAMPETAGQSQACDCAICEAGAPIHVQEWRKLDPRHEQIYQSMIAAVRNGSVQVQGA